MWQYYIRSNNIKFIQAAKLYFNSYLINEYHDQPKLKQYLFEICPTVPAEENAIERHQEDEAKRKILLEGE